MTNAEHNSTQLADLVQRMTPGQRLRVRKLLDELAALKREVLYPTPIEVIEPCLASPRSSLHPDHFRGFKSEQEITDRGLVAEAKRADYQEAERNPVRSRRYLVERDSLHGDAN